MAARFLQHLICGALAFRLFCPPGAGGIVYMDDFNINYEECAVEKQAQKSRKTNLDKKKRIKAVMGKQAYDQESQKQEVHKQETQKQETRKQETKKHSSIDSLIRTIPILMYHDISNPAESEYNMRYTVSPDMFRSHLEHLHKKGFAPVSLDEYLDDDFNSVPEGRRPMLITFDDAAAGQFRYNMDRDNKLIIDPDCAVGIMEDFAEKHEDFRAKAVFFIDFVDKRGYFQVPFEQLSLEKKKIIYLIENGFDVQCHTAMHPFLNKSTQKTLINNIRFYEYIIGSFSNIPGYRTLAFPYGDVPKGKKKTDFLKKHFDFCFGAYGNRYGSRAYRVGSKRFLRYNIPRIEINNDFENIRKYVAGK